MCVFFFSPLHRERERLLRESLVVVSAVVFSSQDTSDCLDWCVCQIRLRIAPSLPLRNNISSFAKWAREKTSNNIKLLVHFKREIMDCPCWFKLTLERRFERHENRQRFQVETCWVVAALSVFSTEKTKNVSPSSCYSSSGAGFFEVDG